MPERERQQQLATRRRLLCWLRQLAYIFSAEMILFKLSGLLFGAYQLVQSVTLLMTILLALILIIIFGLVDETLITIIFLFILLVLMPGADTFINFYQDNLTLLLLHLWIPLYFCRMVNFQKSTLKTKKEN